jgi:hypothetical protein
MPSNRLAIKFWGNAAGNNAVCDEYCAKRLTAYPVTKGKGLSSYQVSKGSRFAGLFKVRSLVESENQE